MEFNADRGYEMIGSASKAILTFIFTGIERALDLAKPKNIVDCGKSQRQASEVQAVIQGMNRNFQLDEPSELV